MQLRCGRCLWALNMPDNPQKTIPCPHCNYSVLIVDEQSKVSYRAKYVEPAWKQPWGRGLFILGALAFVASAYIGGNHDSYHFDLGKGLLAGLLNPLVWVGVVLGFTWGNMTNESHHATKS